MNKLIDETIRQTALDPSQSFIVQAPAGSGKTELLIQRFLVLLSHVQSYPEEVMAITFTRKAAQEMRNRIIEALIAAKAQLPCAEHLKETRAIAEKVLIKDQQLQWHLCENPHRLRILTIDALCTSIVNRMPILTQIGGQPRICEDANELYQQATLLTLTQSYDDPAITAAINTLLVKLDNRLEMVQRLLQDLLAKREQWLPFVVDSGQHHHLREQLEDNLKSLMHEQIQKCQHALSAYPEHPELLSCIQVAAHNLRETNPNDPIAACATLDDLPEADIDNLDQWRGIAAILLKSDGDFRKNRQY